MKPTPRRSSAPKAFGLKDVDLLVQSYGERPAAPSAASENDGRIMAKIKQDLAKTAKPARRS